MKIHFYKYQGTGNDFIMVDNRTLQWTPANFSVIAKLCHRRYGIGADGFILLENKEGFDFKMVYYNADGNESTMCGNGGRCIVQFAHDLGLKKDVYHFEAIDGAHKAEVSPQGVKLQMIDTKEVQKQDEGYFIDTGSPHYVAFRNDLHELDIIKEGRNIRNNPPYDKEGVNVNFVQVVSPTKIEIRTYERGVEDETYSCGTGVTAASLVSYFTKNINTQKLDVSTKGGDLQLEFEKAKDGYTQVWLSGPATFVFDGEIDI